MNIAVIQFPGSNCERETKLALKRSQLTPVDLFWNSPLDELKTMQGFVLVGGFSFEDRIRSGLIASQNPLIGALKAEAKKGKPILGICNGAQILVEAGLVPGNAKGTLTAALTQNQRIKQGEPFETGFCNDECTLTPFSLKETHAFTNQFKPGMTITIPYANGEGRFVLSNEGLEELIATESQLLQYCTKSGEVIDAYPTNPNGSMFNLAAISNRNGNVMAIMPHPERCENGQVIFDSMRHYLETLNEKNFGEHFFKTVLEEPTLSPWQPAKDHQELIIDAVIEDNSAKTLELLLKRQGFETEIKRYAYYSVRAKTAIEQLVAPLEQSNLLWNPNKEFKATLSPSDSLRILIAKKEQVHAKRTLKSLQSHFSLHQIDDLLQATLYEITALNCSNETLRAHLLGQHLLLNPLTEDGYDYAL